MPVAGPASASTSNLPPTISLHPPHSAFFMDPTRNKILCAGRRFGKSMLLIAEALAVAINKPLAEIWYLIAELSQAKRTIWEPMKTMCKPFSESINNNDHLITFKNGSHIRLVPTNVDPDRLRGPGLDLALWDEYKDIKPEAREIVAPAMSDMSRLGRSIFVGTPGGFDHFHELIENNLTNPNYSIYKYTTADGGYVTWEEILQKANEMDSRMWMQEFLASTINFSEGISYYSFDRTQNMRPISFDPDLPIILSMDFNVKPYCTLILQYQHGLVGSLSPIPTNLSSGSGSLYVLDELIIAANANTEKMCDLFLNRTRGYCQLVQRNNWGAKLKVIVTGDASGTAAHTSANFSDWQLVRNFFSSHSDIYEMNFAVPASNPHVRSRVQGVNSVLCSASGLRRLFINSTCEWLRKDLESVVWADTACTVLDQKTHPALTHVSDALGYAVALVNETGLGISGPMPQ